MCQNSMKSIERTKNKKKISVLHYSVYIYIYINIEVSMFIVHAFISLFFFFSKLFKRGIYG